jgi:hypothetical protein
MKERWMMNGKTMCGAAALALMMTVGASDVVGQLGPRGDRPVRGDRVVEQARPARGSGAGAVERLLRLRDRFELTEDQVSRLDALRSEVVAQRGQSTAELEELRSQLRAGTLDRSEARARMQALREDRRAMVDRSRAAVEDILDDEQKAEMEAIQAQRRAFEAGRRSGLRDRARGPARPGHPERSRRRPGVRGGS